MPELNRRSEILRATNLATDLRVALGLSKDEPVDIFAVIRELGVWLTFQKLDNLLGATVRNGVGGILITTERPLNIQRYTAAHELGHWLLHDDDYTGDTEATVLQGSQSILEQSAQVFAASFLMPRQLVQRTLRRLGHRRGDYVSPSIAYQTSRDMGVSYEATLMQLRSLGVIDGAGHSELRRSRPIDIKTALAGGIRPIDSTANVWLPTSSEFDQLNVAVGDEVIVDIPENRTTGYRWTGPTKQIDSLQVDPLRNDAGRVEIVFDEFTPDFGTDDGVVAMNQTSVGTGGRRRLILRAIAPGAWELPLSLTRSFEPRVPPLDKISVRGKVQLEPARLQARIVAGLGDTGSRLQAEAPDV